MNKGVLRRSERLYDLILKFYPKRYRQEFGEEMKYVFSESLKDAYSTNGERGIITVWGRTIIDAGKSLVMQHVEDAKGGDSMKTKRKDIISHNKIFLWIALSTGIILLIPLVGQWPWSLGDFVVMGILLSGAASLFVLVARKVKKKKHRIALGIAFVAVFLYLWVELAVGIFTNWGS